MHGHHHRSHTSLGFLLIGWGVGRLSELAAEALYRVLPTTRAGWRDFWFVAAAFVALGANWLGWWGK